MTTPHVPVMLDEVLERLRPRDDDTCIDATFGAGGYARAILEAADCRVIGLDRDPSAIAAGQDLVDAYAPRLSLVHAPFSQLWPEVDGEGEGDVPDRNDPIPAQVDAVVFDLGVSSMQLDRPERGFSFQEDGPLDMRMSKAGDAPVVDGAASAADVVNTFSEAELADIIFQLGEETRSRAIARAIVARRKTRPFSGTLDLADVVSDAVGGRRGKPHHPATKTFQALRMFVNDELGELVRGLAGAEQRLKPGGRLVAVTFHSLEDRVVKRFMATRSGRDQGVSRHMPARSLETEASSFEIVNQPALTSSKGEIEVNPRSRSARLRSAVRTDAAARPFDASGLGLPGIVRSQN